MFGQMFTCRKMFPFFCSSLVPTVTVKKYAFYYWHIILNHITYILICTVDDRDLHANVYPLLTTKFPLHVNKLVDHKCLSHSQSGQNRVVDSPLE